MAELPADRPMRQCAELTAYLDGQEDGHALAARRLHEHIDAARTQAFAEVVQAFTFAYRQAFADWSACVAEHGVTDDGRRMFARMDAWCDALHLAEKVTGLEANHAAYTTDRVTFR